ncbi:MAG: class I adenylate-forming enzyme family protein [Anaerolineae bacterium]|jgi:acyl-CoA synthetase (AMP-forming)/AMP-acid ligase II
MATPTLTTQMTMGQALRRITEDRPEQESLVCGSLRLTYGQFQEQVDRAAASLGQVGVGHEDRVLFLLPPGVEFVTLFFAAAERGAVAVPLDPRARPQRVSRVIEQTLPALLVTREPPPVQVCETLPEATLLVVTDSSDLSLAGELDSLGVEEPLPPPEVTPDDLLAILYTSGTTGTPKGAMHAHRSLIAPVVASLKLRELWSRRPTLDQLPRMGWALMRYRERLLRAAGRPQVFLSTVGFHTVTGIEAFLQALLMGDTLVIQPYFHPTEALELIQQERVTVLIAVPTALAIMLRLTDVDQYDLSSLLICGTGSAPCPPDLAREVQRRFGCAMHIGFGATELGGGIAATSLGDPDDLQAETVGQPMPGIDVRILDEEGEPLPRGEVGELAVRGESVMEGYWGAPELTEEAVDSEGWYHTGDLAVMDEQGYLRIVGRKKDVIIRGGRSIYPTEVERQLAAHPDIREVAVLGIPSELGGEEVWAFVIPEEGAKLSPHDVREKGRGTLETYEIPQVVRFVEDFPRSSTGKPQKFRLRQMALEQLGEEDR